MVIYIEGVGTIVRWTLLYTFVSKHHPMGNSSINQFLVCGQPN